MQRVLSIALGIGVFCVAQAAWGQTTAMEKAEHRLAELLAPGGKTTLSAFRSAPLPWKQSRVVEEIGVPIRPYAGTPVRLPEPPRQQVKPRSVPEGQPLVSYREQLVVPKEVELPVKPLLRLPSVDVNLPLPIPILAQPQRDRASLAEPALEVSLEAALRPLTPARTQAVPFAPINLPDPFEHVRTAQLRNPPDESPIPPVIPLQKPAK
jgi:hypothetical protein